ncbi:MAG: glycosyltransferase family 4 protein [Bdellovibrionales bacterium]|nr:glycosyltransferase family 4 protein [Bdellovibrionales bacterium]
MSSSSTTRPGVLLIAQQLQIGGLERTVCELSRSLHRSGRWSVHVLTYESLPAPDTFHDDIAAAGIPVIFGHKGRGFSWKVLRTILRYTRQHDIRILHTHDTGPLVYGALARLLSGGRLKQVHTYHGAIQLSHGPRSRLYERLFARVANTLVAVSDEVRNAYAKAGVAAARIRTLHNGVSILTQGPATQAERSTARSRLALQASPAIRDDIERSRDRIWLLCLARLAPTKGQFLLLDMWSQMPRVWRERCALWFVGPDPEGQTLAALRARLKRDQLESEVFLSGPMRNTIDWVQASDVFVSASEMEGLPLSPLEAVGSGLPALLSNIPGHSVFRSATHFRTHDAAQASHQIVKILMERSTDPEAYDARCWNESAYVRNDFSIERTMGNYEDLYLQVLALPNKN